MMPVHGRLSIPELTHHDSRIREEDEDSQAGDIQTQPSTPGTVNTVNPSCIVHQKKVVGSIVFILLNI